MEENVMTSGDVTAVGQGLGDMTAAGQGLGIGMLVLVVIGLALSLLMIISYWKLFNKAGQPGWAILIPIYPAIVMLQIAGKPIWWILLLIVPVVGIVIAIKMLAGIARNFGKGTGFVLGMLFLPIIFWPILGLGSAEYAPVEA